MSLENIRVVLVQTSHPGNIGAAARAMKTMGLAHLRLVGPKYFPHDEATTLASGADDLLQQAEVFETLAAAIADCVLVVGTSARKRTLNWPTDAPGPCARELLAQAASGPVAVVFGRERTGLANDELDYCQLLMHIPTDSAFSSLNLAMAVQIVGYELRLAAGHGEVSAAPRVPAPAQEMERLYDHLEQVMLETGFLDPGNPRYLVRRLRLLINRADPDQNEVNILRGFLASIQRPRVRRKNDH